MLNALKLRYHIYQMAHHLTHHDMAMRLKVPQASLEDFVNHDGPADPRLEDRLAALEALSAKADPICWSIRWLRESLGWSRGKLARLSGVSVPALQKVERGDNPPNLGSARALFAAFKNKYPELSAEAFFLGQEDEVRRTAK
jgi:DNA-binding XRE family transcriptional regulator